MRKYELVVVGGGFAGVAAAIAAARAGVDVLLVDKVSLLQVPAVIGKYKNGRYKELPHLVRHFRVKELTIHCDKPTAINLDGEIRFAKEVEFRICVNRQMMPKVKQNKGYVFTVDSGMIETSIVSEQYVDALSEYKLKIA